MEEWWSGGLGAGHFFLDAGDEVDEVARAKNHDEVVWFLCEVEVFPSLFCVPGEKETLWFLVSCFLFRVEGLSFEALVEKEVAKSEVEVGDVAAEDWFFKRGVNWHQHNLVRFGERRRKFIEQYLCSGIAVWLEHHAEALWLECASH